MGSIEACKLVTESGTARQPVMSIMIDQSERLSASSWLSIAEGTWPLRNFQQLAASMRLHICSTRAKILLNTAKSDSAWSPQATA